jgi:rod shape-determining protein MreD
MWIKYLIIILLFYLFALLQNSFFAHLNLFGAVPNFIFITFFLLVFFGKKDSYYRVIFYAVLAGLFLDIFSSVYIGISMVLLIIIGAAIKKTQSLLKEKKAVYPFVYFLTLFFCSLTAYDLLLQVCISFLFSPHIAGSFGLSFFVGIIYSFFFAIVGFFICKRFIGFKNVIQQI